jgi:C1A family cysteine protease
MSIPAVELSIELPTVAPLNKDFLDSLSGAALDEGSIADVGHPLGIRPLSQDFSYARGLQIPTLDRLGLPQAGSSSGAAEVLPRRYDLREQGKVTPVGDQSPYGTCWSFATNGSLESCLLPAEEWALSEDHMVLTSGFDHGTDAYNWGGNLEMSTAYLVRWGGPVTESSDEYGDGLTPMGIEPSKHVQQVYWIPPRGDPLDNDNIKRAIMDYGGLYVSMSWQDSASGSIYFNNVSKAYYYFGFMRANHAVLIVGWDDDYPASNFALAPFGDGAFIVKNSWGTDFGAEGFFYVSYYDTVFGRAGPMSVYNNAEPPDNYSGIYQYDPLGDINCLGFDGPTAWCANVFTSEENARLAAVGFYALVPGTDYEIYTGPGLSDLAPNTSGTLAYMGYHTVQLSEEMPLASGDPFAIAVKLTSPGTVDPIAIEYPIDGFSSKARAEAGQSYVSSNGADWSDLTEIWDAEANVCLKAYVRD